MEQKRKVLGERAREASMLIEKLVNMGMTVESISKASKVSGRTVYRWWRGGHAPHPILLDGLRKLGLKKGIDNE